MVHRLYKKSRHFESLQHNKKFVQRSAWHHQYIYRYNICFLKLVFLPLFIITQHITTQQNSQVRAFSRFMRAYILIIVIDITLPLAIVMLMISFRSPYTLHPPTFDYNHLPVIVTFRIQSRYGRYLVQWCYNKKKTLYRFSLPTNCKLECEKEYTN